MSDRGISLRRAQEISALAGPETLVGLLFQEVADQILQDEFQLGEIPPASTLNALKRREQLDRFYDEGNDPYEEEL